MADHARRRHPCVAAFILLSACGPTAEDAADVPAPAAHPQDTYVEGSERVWNDARARGVTFRAVGQEPGWLLEISEERLLFVRDYGADTLRDDHAARSQHDGTTRYAASAGGDSVSVLIRAAACTDVMSGERFSATVTVRADGVELNGCGRALR